MLSRRAIFVYLLLCLVLLAGCWSQKELTDLALVSALGIDKNKEGNYVVTYQVVNPANVAAGKQGSGQTAPVAVFTVVGNSIEEASKKATKQVSRRLYYAHTNLLVIGEEIAREEGILKILDAMDRDPDFRTTTTVVIADETKAADIVNRLTPIDKIPANKVIKTLEFSEERWGEFFQVSVQDVIRNVVGQGKQPIISGFTIKGDKNKGKKLNDVQQTTPGLQIETSRMAVFKNGKLINWLKGETARGTSFILNKVKATEVNINWKEEKDAVAYELLRQQTMVSATKGEGGLPVIHIHVQAEGNIGEVMVPLDLTDPKVIAKIEKAVGKEIKKEIVLAVEQAKKDQSDIFGFGEIAHIKDPKGWKGLKDDWNDVHFPKLEVKVTVEAYVRRTGLRTKSYLSNLEVKD